MILFFKVLMHFRYLNNSEVYWSFVRKIVDGFYAKFVQIMKDCYVKAGIYGFEILLGNTIAISLYRNC